MILTLYHITFSSRWLVDLSVIGEAIKLLECEVGEYLLKDFAKNKQKKANPKGKNVKLESIKM